MTIAEKGLSASAPGCAACSPTVIWVVDRELGLHLQSSNRILALSLTIVGKRLYESTPGCTAYHVAYPGEPWLLHSIVEPSTITIFVASRKEYSKSTPTSTACSLRIIQIIKKNLGRYFQNLSATHLAASIAQSFSFTCLSPLHVRGV